MSVGAEGAPRVVLREGPAGLALCSDGLELRADFERLLPRVRRGLGNELLVKAAKVKGLTRRAHVVDATAGLGEDAFVLAAAGSTVELYERDPTIAALLRDALARASSLPELADIVGRMRLRERDSIEALAEMAEAGEAPDVVLLDPMFPARKKSAAVKKKLQLLQLLERPADDEDELLRAALAARPRKVVVKRPAKGPWLAGAKPSYALAGKAVRYDVHVT